MLIGNEMVFQLCFETLPTYECDPNKNLKILLWVLYNINSKCVDMMRADGRRDVIRPTGVVINRP
jgi:hypothetical protein